MRAGGGVDRAPPRVEMRIILERHHGVRHGFERGPTLLSARDSRSSRRAASPARYSASACAVIASRRSVPAPPWMAKENLIIVILSFARPAPNAAPPCCRDGVDPTDPMSAGRGDAARPDPLGRGRAPY